MFKIEAYSWSQTTTRFVYADTGNMFESHRITKYTLLANGEFLQKGFHQFSKIATYKTRAGAERQIDRHLHSHLVYQVVPC